MAIKQLTVFVENKQGSLVSITDTLSKHEVNIRALSIAETQDFGMLRLIVNDTATAEKVLELTRKIVAENNITCLMITHNIPSALALGNKTIMMNNSCTIMGITFSYCDKCFILLHNLKKGMCLTCLSYFLRLRLLVLLQEFLHLLE